jgi:hypothetical protein
MQFAFTSAACHFFTNNLTGKLDFNYGILTSQLRQPEKAAGTNFVAGANFVANRSQVCPDQLSCSTQILPV